MSDATTAAASTEGGTTQATGTGEGTPTTTTTSQPAQGQTGEGAGTQATQTEDIVFDLKMPDGIELDKAATEAFTAIIKDKALAPGERAQKIVDLAVQREQDRVAAHAARVAEWANEVRNDKVLGGDKLDQTLAVARKAVDLGPPELKTLLEVSGMGNHPAFVKWAYAVGQALSEDRFTPGRPGGQTGDAAQRLYGSTAQA